MSAVAKKKKKLNITPPPMPKAETKAPEHEVVEPEVPKFEIGVKGDEFDIKYSRAASKKSHDADKLLQELSRESKADKFNFLSLALPLVIIVIAALSFAFVSRGDIEEMFVYNFSLNTLADGSYTNQLDEIYNETLPFKEGIQRIGAWLGFIEGKPEEPEPIEPDLPEVVLPEVTEPLVTTTEATTTTEETTTTPPTTTETPTTTTTEATVPDTYVLYASATVNIRLEPSTDSMILGYFIANDEVNVIELRSDGWAKIYYSDMIAYCYGEYLSETTVETTVRVNGSRTEATEEAEDPEVTLGPDENEEVNGEDVLTDEGEEPADDESEESVDETAGEDDE